VGGESGVRGVRGKARIRERGRGTVSGDVDADRIQLKFHSSILLFV